MTHLKWIKVVTISVVVFLSGCGSEPEWVGIYEDCNKQVNSSIAEMKDSQQTPEAMNDMMQTMATAACEMIKSTCENDPDGTMCQSIVKGYKDKE